MKKRVLILLMILCLAAAIALICRIAVGCETQETQETQQVDLEALRDQIKQYDTAAVGDTSSEQLTEDSVTEELTVSDTEQTVEPETEETLPPETTEAEITETEPVTEPEPETQTEKVTEPVTTAAPVTKAETETKKQVETSAQIYEPQNKTEASLDFRSLWRTNPDICAWIEIAGTKVDYPVLQSPHNDSKYLTTAVNGSYYIGGSLFTQATYNSRDFNDPVTVIYGHTMRSGTLFGQLQSTYSNAKSFKEHSVIKLYLPDEVRYYTVFAAVPYAMIHILDTYDFSNNYWYRNFFKGVMATKDLRAQFNKDIMPEPGDRVLILSTCLNEDSTKRFLVMAIYQGDI